MGPLTGCDSTAGRLRHRFLVPFCRRHLGGRFFHSVAVFFHRRRLGHRFFRFAQVFRRDHLVTRLLQFVFLGLVFVFGTGHVDTRDGHRGCRQQDGRADISTLGDCRPSGSCRKNH